MPVYSKDEIYHCFLCFRYSVTIKSLGFLLVCYRWTVTDISNLTICSYIDETSLLLVSYRFVIK